MKKLLSILLAFVGVAQAQIPISNLPSATTPLTGTEVMILNQSSVTKKTAISNLNGLFPPLTATYVLQSANAGVPNSRTLTGTANEIILADGGALGNLTLSTPQPIATTSSPTFAGLTLTSPLTTPNGGTGFSSYAVGDLLTAGGTTVLSKLPDVAVGNVLRAGGVGVVPAYGKVVLTTDVTGTLPVGNGGTGVATLTGLALGNGAAAFSAYAGTSCTNQFPRSLSASGVATCATVQNTDLANSSITINGTSVALGGTRTLTLASADFANQGTTTTVLHGNAAGNPSFGAVTSSDLAAGVFANPTGTIGLSAVNGAATTAPRSDSAPALSQAIAPTWSAQHIFSKSFATSGTSGDYAIFEKSAIPAIALDATGAAADAKVWEFSVVSTDLFGRISNDAGSTTKNFLDVTRAANVVSAIVLGNATDNNTFTFAGSGAGTVSGAWTYNLQTGVILSHASGPQLRLFATGAAANAGNTLVRLGSGGTYAISSATDAAPTTVVTDMLTAARSGSAWGTVTIGNSTDNTPVTISGNGTLLHDGASAAAGVVLNIFRNSTATGYSSFRLYNDQNSSARSVEMDYTGSTFSGTAVTNGPSGEQGTIGTTGAFPFTIYTSNTARILVTSAGLISMPNITNSSAAQTGTMCWSSSNISYDPTVGCLTSSIRFKKNVEALGEGLDAVMRMRPVSYDLRPEYDTFHLGRQVGMIAEEIEKVDPRLVGYEPDGKTVRGIRYNQLTAVLVGAIQDQERQIRQLQVAVGLLSMGLLIVGWKAFRR